MTHLEIYDSTLRDGLQAVGAHIDFSRRVALFHALYDFGTHFIELGWPTHDKEDEFVRVFDTCRTYCKQATMTAFGSTSITPCPEDDSNYASILKTGTPVVCLFGKSWEPHVKGQLRITLEENLKRIETSVAFFKAQGLRVFYDAEHYFDGYKEDASYALETVLAAERAGAERLVLCDTNGGTSHRTLFSHRLGIQEIVKETRHALDIRDIDTGLGVHLHDDRGQALDATLECLPFIVQVQGTMHGRGERVGNLNLVSFIARYALEGGDLAGIDTQCLRNISDLSYQLSGIPLPDPDNRLFVGETVFAHKGGVHIDAMAKGASYEHASPEHFGNKRNYVLNTLGGRSGIIENAAMYGFVLDKKDPRVVKRIDTLYGELQRMEHRGYRIGTLDAEKFLLIEKHFGNHRQFLQNKEWNVNTGRDERGTRFSHADIVFTVNGRDYHGKAELSGRHGPIDALYKSFLHALSPHYPVLNNLSLAGFDSKIAHRHGEESTMRTLVSLHNTETLETVGVDTNIIGSAIEALTKGFQCYLQKYYRDKMECFQ